MSQNFLSINEAARKLQCSTQTVRRMLKRGEIQAEKMKTPQGYQYIIPLSELEEHLPTSQLNQLSQQVDQLDMQMDSQRGSCAGLGDVIKSVNGVVRSTDQSTNPVSSSVLIQLNKENIKLIELCQKLQVELDQEKRKPRSFLAHLFDWFTGWN